MTASIPNPGYAPGPRRVADMGSARRKTTNHDSAASVRLGSPVGRIGTARSTTEPLPVVLQILGGIWGNPGRGAAFVQVRGSKTPLAQMS